MKIGNLLNSFKSSNTFEGIFIGETGYRSNALKSKALDMKLKGCLLIDISEALNVSYDRVAKWCANKDSINSFDKKICKYIGCNNEFVGAKQAKYCCSSCKSKQRRKHKAPCKAKGINAFDIYIY